MTTWIKHLIPLLAIGLLNAESSLPPQQLPPEVELLESELALAQASPTYLMINTSTGTIRLKARGIVLREWKITDSSPWGYPYSSKPRSLLEKSVLLPPRRERIKPGESGKEDPFDLQALELSDMPKNFSAVLEDNVRIQVHPSSRGLGRIPGFAASCFNQLLRYPLRTIIFALQGKKFPVLDLQLESGIEVQALYWALREDTNFLVFSQAE